MTPQQLYKDLFAGNRLTLQFEDKKHYESVRVALHKLHQTPKLLLELTDASLCSRYNESTQQGVFWLGNKRSRAINIVSIEAVNDDTV